MPTFQDVFNGMPVRERRRIAETAGTTLGYLSKHMYTRAGEPKFKFHTAVALDKASDGTLPFWLHTEGAVDWAEVRRRLNTAKRKGQLA